MTSLHSRVKSSKIQAVKTGRGLQPPVSLLTEQVVNSAGWRDGQVQPPAQRAQTHRAGFRGFNPKVSGGNSLQKSVSSSAAARRPEPKARRPLDDPLRRALIPPYPRASRSGAARLRPRARGAEGGPPAPPRRLLRLVAAPRPRNLLAETLRPRRCPASGRVPSPAPLPSAHRAGWAGPSTGPIPVRHPGSSAPA